MKRKPTRVPMTKKPHGKSSRIEADLMEDPLDKKVESEREASEFRYVLHTKYYTYNIEL